MSFIYLASPYTHHDQEVVRGRYRAVQKATVALLQDEQHVYSPIVHCHELAQDFQLPTDFEFWQRYNKAILAKASQLYVLMLDGWKESKGVTEEIRFAKEAGVELHFFIPEAFDADIEVFNNE